MAQARVRARLRRRHCPGLRDYRRHRLRGTLGLRSDRHGHQPRRAPLRRGQTRPDSDPAAPLGNGGSADRGGARGGADPEGFPAPRHHLQRPAPEGVKASPACLTSSPEEELMMNAVQSEGQSVRGVDQQRMGQIVVRDVICPGCADLCDDLELTIEGDRIVGMQIDCPGAREFFLDYPIKQISPMVRGNDVTSEEALEEAARILAKARSPLIMGLSATAAEAQRRAVELAEALGGCLDVPYSAFTARGRWPSRKLGSRRAPWARSRTGPIWSSSGARSPVTRILAIWPGMQSIRLGCFCLMAGQIEHSSSWMCDRPPRPRRPTSFSRCAPARIMRFSPHSGPG